MTDKALEKQKKRVRRYLDKWRNLLCLWNWTGGVSWSEERKTGEPEGAETLADVYVDWKYLDYCINFYLPCLPGKTDKEIERYVIHEMAHILVNEMREEGIKHEERVASQLTNALLNVYEMGQKKPIKIKPVKKVKKK